MRVNTYGGVLPSVDDALAAGLGRLFDAASAPADNVTPLRRDDDDGAAGALAPV